MKYRDRVLVTRPSSEPGTQDPVTGKWVGPAPIVVLDAPARVQAGGLLRANRVSTSQVQVEADGRFFVPPRFLSMLMNVVEGDKVVIEYAPMRDADDTAHYAADAVVLLVQPESRECLLRYV